MLAWGRSRWAVSQKPNLIQCSCLPSLPSAGEVFRFVFQKIWIKIMLAYWLSLFCTFYNCKSRAWGILFLLFVFRLLFNKNPKRIQELLLRHITKGIVDKKILYKSGRKFSRMNPRNICVPKEDVAVSQLLITNKYKHAQTYSHTHTHTHTCKSEIFTLRPKTILFFIYKLTVSRIKKYRWRYCFLSVGFSFL